nr:MAG TPA: hypothetical protein [Caudoviricetes sp.]DAS81414.1 MAG TPA: hypothetical protein [Caudoviricetes sp.]
MNYSYNFLYNYLKMNNIYSYFCVYKYRNKMNNKYSVFC